MAEFAIAIADTDVERVMNAVAANYNWQENISNPEYDPADPDAHPEFIPNPENKFVFTNRMVRRFLSDHVQAYEVNLAKKAAADAVNATIDISDPQV